MGRVVRADLRDYAIREIGCICCWLMGLGKVECEKHHLLSTGLHGNGHRLGERHTIGLCTYHHRGRHGVGSRMAALLRADRGPSYADEPREFRAQFGTDAELLAAQDAMIGAFEKTVIGGR